MLQAIVDEGLVERANRIGAMLAAGLRALAVRHPMIGEVRGRGLALGVELISDQQTRAPAPVITTAKVIFRAYQLGAVFFYVGMRSNVLEFTPPLTLSESEVEEGLAIIDQAMRDVANGLIADAEVEPYMMW